MPVSPTSPVDNTNSLNAGVAPVVGEKTPAPIQTQGLEHTPTHGTAGSVPGSATVAPASAGVAPTSGVPGEPGKY